jgi:3-polyprenyl-4-hydroxybenzoate decarboxylase
VGDVLFTSKPGINAPKTLLVEDDIDITDLGEVVWACATRAHPEHGEFHFPDLPSGRLAVYLDETGAHSFRAAKVICNCLLADRFPAGQRPSRAPSPTAGPPRSASEYSPTGTPAATADKRQRPDRRDSRPAPASGEAAHNCDR